MKNTATIKKNALYTGIEIYFDGKPGADVIARLKEDLRARWHSAKKCWYCKDTPENARTAAEIVGQADAHAQSGTTTHAQKIPTKVLTDAQRNICASICAPVSRNVNGA